MLLNVEAMFPNVTKLLFRGLQCFMLLQGPYDAFHLLEELPIVPLLFWESNVKRLCIFNDLLEPLKGLL